MVANPPFHALDSHVARTSEIALFSIMSEDAVAKGVRRIVAVSALDARRVRACSLPGRGPLTGTVAYNTRRSAAADARGERAAMGRASPAVPGRGRAL